MAKRANRRELSVGPTNLPQAQEPVDEIRALHTEIVGLMETSLEKAARIGELLIEIKSELPHGEFIPWISENLPFGDRMARKYMRVFENREQIENGTAVPFSGVNRMLEAVKKPTASSASTSEDEPEPESEPRLVFSPDEGGVPPRVGALAVELTREYVERVAESRVPAADGYLMAMIEAVLEFSERLHRAGHVGDREIKKLRSMASKLR